MTKIPPPYIVETRRVFSIVSQHLLRQRRRSVVNGLCAYRGANGRMCAVGCLIDADAYNPMLERRSVKADTVQKALEASGVKLSRTVETLLFTLQKIHDLTHPRDWPMLLGEVKKIVDGKFTAINMSLVMLIHSDTMINAIAKAGKLK